jgi:hypothetical protein
VATDINICPKCKGENTKWRRVKGGVGYWIVILGIVIGIGFIETKFYRIPIMAIIFFIIGVIRMLKLKRHYRCNDCDTRWEC